MEKKKFKPSIEGDWLIGPNPENLDSEVQNTITPGEYRAGQEVVDHHIWKDAHGEWRLWACVRHTKVGRVFVGWVSDDLEKSDWKCLGIVMRRDRNFGESLADHGNRLDGEKLQSPFVIFENGEYYMFYGGGEAEAAQYHKLTSICVATSNDGIEFTRCKNQYGDSVLFYGPGPARDPCLIKIEGLWHLYYSGGETGFPSPNKDYVRTSYDLYNWSASREVCWGGSVANHPSSAECPCIIFYHGYYYLFRTEDYPTGRTFVFRSEDPYDFGLNTDRFLLGQIDVAAPEIVADGNRHYISSNKDVYGGVRLHHLKWVEE